MKIKGKLIEADRVGGNNVLYTWFSLDKLVKESEGKEIPIYKRYTNENKFEEQIGTASINFEDNILGFEGDINTILQPDFQSICFGGEYLDIGLPQSGKYTGPFSVVYELDSNETKLFAGEENSFFKKPTFEIEVDI